MAATAKSKTNQNARRDACYERLQLERERVDVDARVKSANATLIAIAGEEGAFREVFEAEGMVDACPEKPAEFKGEVPEVVVEKFLALTEAKRAKLIADGIIEMKPKYTRADHGRVTPKLF